jgi:predicted MFS family arabinose efflux permease
MKKVIALYKDSYSGLSAASWWLSLVMLVNRCGTMVVPFLTLYITQHLHRSIADAGLVMALFGAGAVFGGFIGGRLTDRFGFYPVQLCTLAAGGVMFTMLGQLQHYPSICVFTFLLSVVNESFRPANAAAIAHYSKEENRTRSYSLNRLAINLGWALGGALGGFLAAKNYQLLFWIDGFSNISAAILLWVALKPAGKTAMTARQHKTKHVVSAAQSPYRDKEYILFILFTILFAYAFFQLFSTLPVFFREQLHFSESFIGLTMSLNGLLIVAFEMITIFQLEGRKHSLQFIAVGSLLLGLSYLVYLFPLHSSHSAILVALASTLLITAGEVFAMPFMNTYWISRTNNDNRGQYAGLYTVAWASAQVLGPATGALIVQYYGFPALWSFIPIVCLLCATGFWWLYTYGRNRHDGVKKA